LRLYRAQPRVFIALAASGLALLLAIGVWVVQWQKADEAEQAEQAMRLAGLRKALPGVAFGPVARAQLPAFNSAELVSALNQVADAARLPIDEVTFTLDNTAKQPYLRYRFTLTAAASYPVIRRFVDRFGHELAHVSLDAIACTRDNVAKPGLTCDLAFYRKA
jgi:hypothetical protein